MTIYIRDDRPATGSQVVSDAANAAAKPTPDPIVLGEKIPVRVVRVDGAGAVLATTGYTCSLALGTPGSTPVLTEETMTAVTTPAGWQETIDFGTADMIALIGSSTEPVETTLAVAIYDASSNKRVILQTPIKVYPKVL